MPRREIAATWRVDASGLDTLTELFRYDALLPSGSSHKEEKLIGKDKAQAGKE